MPDCQNIPKIHVGRTYTNTFSPLSLSQNKAKNTKKKSNWSEGNSVSWSGLKCLRRQNRQNRHSRNLFFFLPQFGCRGHFGQNSPLENWSPVIGIAREKIDNAVWEKKSYFEHFLKVDWRQKWICKIRNENWRKTRPIVEDKSAKGAEKFCSNEEV